MARGKRHTSVGISLFAFQDIIISVTGVLILIVLLLVLELVNQPPLTQLQENLQQLSAEMQAELDFLSTEVEQLERILEQDDQLVQLVIANPESQLDRRLQQEEQRLLGLETRIASLEAIEQNLSKEMTEQEQMLEQISQLQAEIAELKQRQTELLERLSNIREHNAARYLTPRGINPEQAWLCEVNGSGLHLSLLEASEKPLHLPVRDWETDEALAFSHLKAALARLSPRARYVLFIVRPSGRFINDSLFISGKELNTEFGVEYVSEEHIILR